MKNVQPSTDKKDPLNPERAGAHTIIYKFVIRSVTVEVVEDASQINKGDFVVVLVDEIHKSKTPPTNQEKNPWIDPAGYATFDAAISVIEMSSFKNGRSHILPHEIFHNMEVKHSDHRAPGLMSYWDNTSFNLQPDTQESMQLRLQNMAFLAVWSNSCSELFSAPNDVKSIKKALKGDHKIDYDESKIQ